MPQTNCCPRKACRGRTTHSRLIHHVPLLAPLRPSSLRWALWGRWRRTDSLDTWQTYLEGDDTAEYEPPAPGWLGYDRGGALPPGHVAQTSSPERVLTPEQCEAYPNRNYGEDER